MLDRMVCERRIQQVEVRIVVVDTWSTGEANRSADLPFSIEGVQLVIGLHVKCVPGLSRGRAPAELNSQSARGRGGWYHRGGQSSSEERRLD